MDISENWLSHEDEICFSQRVERLEWLTKILPEAQFLTFPGGTTAKYLFEEARYCFIYGQYLAVIFLGLAFLEKTLAAWFYASGRNDLKRAGISRLLKEAKNEKWLTEDEYDNLERIRSVRNPIAHFRAPLEEDTVEFRALTNEEQPYSLIEQDSRIVLEAVMQMLGRNAV